MQNLSQKFVNNVRGIPIWIKTVRGTVIGEQTTTITNLITRGLHLPWKQRVLIVLLDGLSLPTSFEMQNFTQMVTQEFQRSQRCLFSRQCPGCQARMHRTCTETCWNSAVETQDRKSWSRWERQTH